MHLCFICTSLIFVHVMAIILIKTGNIHKQIIFNHKLSLILLRRDRLQHGQTDGGGGNMLVAFTITEI